MNRLAFSQIGALTLTLSLGFSATAVSAAAPGAAPTVAAKASAGRLLGPSQQKAPVCQGRPEFVRANRTEIVGGFEALPKEVFIAREAEMWVEGHDEASALKIHSFQSFVNPRSRAQGKIVCASSAAHLSDRYSLIAPTLIDRTTSQRTGQSLWQFQIIADNGSYSVWNKQSPSLAKAGNVEAVLKSQHLSYRLFQIGPDEYELLVQKEAAGSVETLSVRYEASR